MKEREWKQNQASPTNVGVIQVFRKLTEFCFVNFDLHDFPSEILDM